MLHVFVLFHVTMLHMYMWFPDIEYNSSPWDQSKKIMVWSPEIFQPVV